MGLTLITPPAMEPVSLDEAKDHLRVSSDDDDAYITGLVITAREMVENDTGRALLTQTWNQTFDDGWPWSRSTSSRTQRDSFGYPGGLGSVSNRGRYQIVLKRPPFQSLVGVTYIDLAGVEQTLSPTLYKVNKLNTGEWAVDQGFNAQWPIVQTQPNAGGVTFVAGYGDSPGSIPEPLRLSILLLCGEWYDQRSPVNVNLRGEPAELPNMVEQLVRRYRVFY
jgi:hypothetical protein